jgi:phospholipid/cholesterol/gamma-HCH transport system substrate-binding protein
VNLAYPGKGFRYVNQAVGAFVLLAMILFSAAFIFSSQVREWLYPGQLIKVILPSDGLFGLAEGADVEVLGTRSGKVVRIVINPDQQMHADVRIQSDMKPFVRQDSKAVIRKRFGVAGSSYLDISRGKGAALDWEFAVINAAADRAPTESIGVIIDEVRTKIFPVIDDTQEAIRMFLTIVQRLQDPDGDLQQLLGHLKTVSGKIARGEGAFGRLITEDKLVQDFSRLLGRINESVGRWDPLFDELETTVGNVAEISTQFNQQAKNLPQISRDLKALVASVRAVMTDLSRATPQLPRLAENVSETADNVPLLILQTQQVMVELEQLIVQLQSSWLLGGSAAKSQPADARISPLEVRP